jgi:hypothetical protein
VDNGGLRYGAVEGALRLPLPTATQSALHDPTILLGLRRPKIGARLTDPSRRNIIAPIRGSERWVAGFKSESRPASDRNRWPASLRNAWPASSESAIEVEHPQIILLRSGFLLSAVDCFEGVVSLMEADRTMWRGSCGFEGQEGSTGVLKGYFRIIAEGASSCAHPRDEGF